MDSKVEQFVAITGAPYDVARSLLEACGGNLELAVNMQMEGGGSSSSLGASKGAGGSSGEPSGARTDEILSPTSYEAKYGVRAPIPHLSGVLVEEDHAPRRPIRQRRLPQTVFDPFQDYRNTGKIGGPGDSGKKKALAELFKPPHDIMFHGGFHEAKQMGQHQRKWLLVNLQDSKDFSSQVLNRDIWNNHNVKDIVRQYFVFWQVYSITDEGLKFKHLYHVTSFPYIAIIDPMTGEKMAEWGALTVSAFTEAVLTFLSNHQYESNLPSGSKKQEKGVVDQSEESLLAAAIQASLQDAQELKKKEQLIFSDDSEVDCISVASSDPEDNSVEFVGNSLGGESTTTRLLDVEYVGQTNRDIMATNGHTGFWMNRKRLSNRSNDELCDDLPRKMMRTDISEPSSQVENNIYRECSKHKEREEVHFILFRLPDGSRLQKQFLSSSPIKEMFFFLKSHGLDESDHEVVTQFPRRNLCEANPTATFKELGLHPRETIFVHTTE